MLAKYNGRLTYESLYAMRYIEQIINGQFFIIFVSVGMSSYFFLHFRTETLRKYPPAASLSRVVTKEYECPDTKMVFRSGMSVVISVYGIHHDPDIYEKPEEFRPERFTAEEIKKRPNCSFIPFGDGPRNCIGMRFAMMEARIALVMLLKQFKFATCDRSPQFPITFSTKTIVLSPLDGVWLNVQPV